MKPINLAFLISSLIFFGLDIHLGRNAFIWIPSIVLNTLALI